VAKAVLVVVDDADAELTAEAIRGVVSVGSLRSVDVIGWPPDFGEVTALTS
jgi:hypothetical protein